MPGQETIPVPEIVIIIHREVETCHRTGADAVNPAEPGSPTAQAIPRPMPSVATPCHRPLTGRCARSGFRPYRISKCRRALAFGVPSATRILPSGIIRPREQQHPNRRSGVVPGARKVTLVAERTVTIPARPWHSLSGANPFGTLLPMDFEHDFRHQPRTLRPRRSPRRRAQRPPESGGMTTFFTKNGNPVLVRRTGPEDRPERSRNNIFLIQIAGFHIFTATPGVFPRCAKAHPLTKITFFRRYPICFPSLAS